PQLTLERVTVGKLQEIKIDRIVVSAGPFALLGAQKGIDSAEVESVTLEEEALAWIPGWIRAPRDGQSLQLDRLRFSAVRAPAAMAGIIPQFNADIAFARNGALQKAVFSDGRIRVDAAPKDGAWQIDVSARSWAPPAGPALEFDDLTFSAVVQGRQAVVSGVEGRLGRGTVKGSAKANWEKGIRLAGDFNLAGGDLGQLMPAYTRDFAASGNLAASGTYVLQGNALSTLFAEPRVEASFTIEKGVLNNVDIVRAIQSPSRDGYRGGRTPFNELVGTLQVDGQRWAYRQLRLSSGPMNATGSFDIGPDGGLSGRISAEVGTGPVIVARGSLNVDGNVKTPLLKP
ncbi:MAG: hypothetical protein KIT18_13815, partial [Burkholderiales bacterium]|nr:hypothetical protein [Burkholderiales bacterium]